MSNLCSQQNCTGKGTKSCSACLKVHVHVVSYCSVECQRANWKEHKIICGKKLLSETELNYFLANEERKASRLDLADMGVRAISYLEKFFCLLNLNSKIKCQASVTAS